jgi:hypothetical protein
VLWHFDELSEFARSGHGGFNATGHSRHSCHPGVSGSPQGRTFGQCRVYEYAPR